MESGQNYRDHGNRYNHRERERQRSAEPPVRRRSVYSPDPPPVSRNYRHRGEDEDRRFRSGFPYRRRDGIGRRFSRFDSRESPPRRRRHSRSSSEDRSPPRRSYHRDRQTSFDHRYRFRQGDSVDSSRVDRSYDIPETPASIQPVDVANHSFSNGPVSVASTPAYQNDTHATIPPFYPPLTAEQNHIPSAAIGQHFYRPPPMNMNHLPAPVPVLPENVPDKGPDEEVVRKILDNLKTKGVIDKFRKTFLEECEDKPDYKKLSERVSRTVSSFLKTRSWLPEINKNTERHCVRRRVLESSYFARELDEMLDRCLFEAESFFMPDIEDSVYDYLGIEKPVNEPNDTEKQPEEDNGDGDEPEKDESEAEAEDVESGSGSSRSSYMDVDSTDEEAEQGTLVSFPPVPMSSAPPFGSFYPSLIPGQLGTVPSFDRIAQLVPNHPPPPPLPPPLGFGRHIPILSNTIMMRNPVENPPLPPSDDEDENPPLPSEDDSSNSESDSENSDSEEISVGHATPPEDFEGISASQSSIIQADEEDEKSCAESYPASPPVCVEEFKTPKEIPFSPRRVEVDDVKGQSLSEGEESPQPPPPGEEDSSAPIFLSRTELQSSTSEASVVKSEAFQQIPIQPPPVLPPPPTVAVPPPPPPPPEPEEIPLPVDFYEEIPLPVDDLQMTRRQSQASAESDEIPFPLDEVEIENELVLQEIDQVVEPPHLPGQIPFILENQEESDSDDSDSSYENSPSPPPSPLLSASQRDIPMPVDDTIKIPLPTCEDLSPVTSGDLDDISDESLTEIPFPPSDQFQDEELEEGEIELPMEVDEEESTTRKLALVEEDLPIVSSSTVEIEQDSTSVGPIELPTVPEELEAGINERAEKFNPEILEDLGPRHLMEEVTEVLEVIEMPESEISKSSVQYSVSPTNFDLPLGESPGPLQIFEPPVATSPGTGQLLEYPLTMSPKLAESPLPLQIVEDEEDPAELPARASILTEMPPPPPAPPLTLKLLTSEIENENVFEEDDDEWESPAFEKFGETSPPRIDKVEEESFENLIHVSPQKKPPDEKNKEERRSSSHHHRHRHHHSKDRSSHRKSSESSRKHSASSSHQSKRDASSHRKSHKSSRSQRRSDGDGNSNSESKKKKDSKRRSRSNDRHRKESSSKREKVKSSSSSEAILMESEVLAEGRPAMSLETKELSCVAEVRVSSPKTVALELENVWPDAIQVMTQEDTTKDMPLEEIEVMELDKCSADGTLILDGESIEVVRYLEGIPSIELKMRYYSKYMDPLLMDDEVSLDSVF